MRRQSEKRIKKSWNHKIRSIWMSVASRIFKTQQYWILKIFLVFKKWNPKWWSWVINNLLSTQIKYFIRSLIVIKTIRNHSVTKLSKMIFCVIEKKSVFPPVESQKSYCPIKRNVWCKILYLNIYHLNRLEENCFRKKKKNCRSFTRMR